MTGDGGAGSAGSGPTTLLVIAKEPVPGRVKTRLTPPFTPEEAALLAEAALRGHPGDGGPCARPPTGAGAGRESRAMAARRLRGRAAVRGRARRPARGGLRTVRRTRSADRHGHPADHTAAAGACRERPAWEDCDAWFGPAEDGGFWALGLASPQPGLLRGVPMSTDRTGEAQRQRLVDAGLSVRDLPVLRDVDTAADAAQIAASSRGHFATAHANLVRAVAS